MGPNGGRTHRTPIGLAWAYQRSGYSNVPLQQRSKVGIPPRRVLRLLRSGNVSPTIYVLSRNPCQLKKKIILLFTVQVFVSLEALLNFGEFVLTDARDDIARTLPTTQIDHFLTVRPNRPDFVDHSCSKSTATQRPRWQL